MNLMDHLPWRVYHDEAHVADFQGAVQLELDRLWQAREDLFRQTRPSTATWGMGDYEREYGIQPNGQKPMEQRLASWRARRRGRGTTTEELIREVAQSFTGGPVEVLVSSREYLLEVRVADEGGTPASLSDMMELVWEIRPAHLDMRYRVPVNTPTTTHTLTPTHHHHRHHHPLTHTLPPSPPPATARVAAPAHHHIQHTGGTRDASNDQ